MSIRVPDTDPTHGYEAAAAAFRAQRESAAIGAATIRDWARLLPAGCDVLDLGCGSGVPVSTTLRDAGLNPSGIDASPTLIAAYRANLPGAPTACEAVGDSAFFGRRFSGIVAIGLLFLLPADEQRLLLARAARALDAGGRLLFSAPREAGRWADRLTNTESLSLGFDAYCEALSAAGLVLEHEYLDEGDNHHYAARRIDERT